MSGLFTIGYEKASLDHFIGTLQRAKINVLIDVRDRAQSRRKGFSKTVLSKTLSEHSIEYRHMRVLGDPKEGRDAARAGKWNLFREIYSEVVAQPMATLALDEIVFLLKEKNVCLMCYERNHAECHRKIVVDILPEHIALNVSHIGVQKIEPVRSLCNNSESATT